jgi:hypothetical protein
MARLREAAVYLPLSPLGLAPSPKRLHEAPQRLEQAFGRPQGFEGDLWTASDGSVLGEDVRRRRGPVSSALVGLGCTTSVLGPMLRLIHLGGGWEWQQTQLPIG